MAQIRHIQNHHIQNLFQIELRIEQWLSNLQKRQEEARRAAGSDAINALRKMSAQRQNERKLAEEREIQRKAAPVIDDVFEVGQRVFHGQMGIGHITDVMNIGESIMYTIDFGAKGKKAMDATYAKLKKF